MEINTEFAELNKAIENAGIQLMHYFGKQLSLTYKSTGADYRTQADVAAEKIILKAIEEIFPDYNIFSEERGTTNKNSRYTFIVDPLDGTNNFALNIPVFSSSVALLKDDEIIYGVIHCPVTKDTYCAIKNKGAYLNGKAINVNDEDNPQRISAAYFRNYLPTQQRIADFQNKLLSLDIRRCVDLWSPAFTLCLLASGKIEAIINDGIELYDYAAGKLIAEEAGAKTTDFYGNKLKKDATDYFITTNNPTIHSFVIENLVDTNM